MQLSAGLLKVQVAGKHVLQMVDLSPESSMHSMHRLYICLHCLHICPSLGEGQSLRVRSVTGGLLLHLVHSTQPDEVLLHSRQLDLYIVQGKQPFPSTVRTNPTSHMLQVGTSAEIKLQRIQLGILLPHRLQIKFVSKYPSSLQAEHVVIPVFTIQVLQ